MAETQTDDNNQIVKNEQPQITTIDGRPFTVDWQKKVVISSAPMEEIERAWEAEFTDPNSHDPNKFRYLVHGIQSPLGRILQSSFAARVTGRRSNRLPSEVLDQSPTSRFIEELEKIRSQLVVSASVIDEGHTRVFAPEGYVLRVPGANVIRCFPRTLGTLYFEPDSELGRDRNICTPTELVTSTPPGVLNEVVLAGKSPSGKLEVIGCFVIVDKTCNPISKDAKFLEYHARSEGLPFIRLSQNKSSKI